MQSKFATTFTSTAALARGASTQWEGIMQSKLATTFTSTAALVWLLAGAASSSAQHPPGEQGSTNVHIVAHLPLGGPFTVSDVEIEQELSRPFAYVARMHGSSHVAGVTVLDLKDPERASSLYSWTIEEPELHRGMGGMDNKYFKLNGRYYDVQSFQWMQGGPNADLGAVVFDVTGLPDASQVREVGRIRERTTGEGFMGIGGFHNICAYKHSDGRVLLFTTVWAKPHAHIYDMEQLLSGGDNYGLVGRVPIPENPGVQVGIGYHDIYVGYDPATRQDRYYGGGAGGYYIFDVSRTDAPKLLTSITGVAGVRSGHTFTPTADGRYVVAETEYQYAPLRIFDLKPGLDGEVQNISKPIGAWTARWKGLPHNHEVRWPYVFVSGYEDGLHVFNMMDPTNPYTVGYYDSYDGPHQRGWGGVDSPETGTGVTSGAFGVDVRNADGLIVLSDFHTGFWAFKMDGFDGWNGHQWGMPNVSSAQDWDNGPEGAPAPARVSARE